MFHKIRLGAALRPLGSGVVWQAVLISYKILHQLNITWTNIRVASNLDKVSVNKIDLGIKYLTLSYSLLCSQNMSIKQK